MQNLNRRLPAGNFQSIKTVMRRFTCLCILFAIAIHPGVAETPEKDNTRELESVRNQIQDVKSDLDTARTESELLQKELQATEMAAGRESLRLKRLEQQIEKLNDRLAELNQVLAGHAQALSTERSTLARQVRSAYMAGRSDYLKLLLNQEDPARVGRMLAYYDYYNRARISSINTIQEKAAVIRELQENIEDETRQLQDLKGRQLAKREELLAYRESRQAILERLQAEIDDKGLQLKALTEHEHKLSALLDQLHQDDDAVFFEDLPAFASLKGKLQWPVEGRLLNTFGSLRRGGTLKWQGVKIGAGAGDDVYAVHTGKVIFADWFRNLGLLMIIDHGDDYMSLYGYNQNLLKKPGDWVLAGETIAYAGDTGGQTTPGVYFEIRHRGKPENPSLWCRR